MISRLSLLALTSALTLAGTARAADTQAVDTYLAITGSAPAARAAGGLAPLEAREVELATARAVLYYTHDEGGVGMVRVVTTVGTDTDGTAPPARFVSYLAAGQKAEVSIAGPAGTAPATLELAYDGVRLVVRSAAARPQS